MSYSFQHRRRQADIWTNFLPFVMPGLDPGTAATAGVRGDPRIKSGDDEERIMGHER
jgi:hypothetical protein